MGLRKFFLKFLIHVILSLTLLVTLWFGTILIMSATDMMIPANQVEKDVASLEMELDVHEEISPEELPAGAGYAIWKKDGMLLSSSLSKNELEIAKQLAASDDVQRNEGFFTHVYKKLETDTQIIIVVYQFQAHFANPILHRIFPSFDLSMLALLLLSVAADLILISFRYAKKLKLELLPLQNAAEQIKQQNLDFEMPRSRFHEFNHVLDSLDALKNELKHSLTEQWEAEQLKKKQMAALAHDINTPLTILQGNTELLQESSLDEEQTEYTRFILENTYQIRDYVSRMIEVSKNSQRSSSPVCRNLPALLAGILENAKNLDWKKNLHFCFSSEHLPDMIPVPEDSFRRAVWNLIDNAVQYSPVGGTIQLLTECLQEKTGRMFFIQVCDEGCGFSEEALHYATTEFYRADESRGDRAHFGMGLAITKQIIYSVNGEIRIENRPEGGASVTLLIPF